MKAAKISCYTVHGYIDIHIHTHMHTQVDLFGYISNRPMLHLIKHSCDLWHILDHVQAQIAQGSVEEALVSHSH